MDRVLSQFNEVVALSESTWTAREQLSTRQVLIKRLPDSESKTRATQALALRHPRIVPTRRWMLDGDALYLVRDWVPGNNLRQTLSQPSLRAFDRLHGRLSPLLDALDFAHTAGIAHGAVTPENVLSDARFPDQALLSDFGAARPSETPAEPRRDFYDLCSLYKEFLPSRPADDEAGTAARLRLLRNLTETQQTAESAEELRYKLDAIARMADLLGFSAQGLEEGAGRQRLGAKLLCTVSPPTATLSPGGGTFVTLEMDNDGDAPLHIESVTSDVVWLNLPNRFVPVTLEAGTGGDLIWTLSGARLESGTYTTALTIRSNDGLLASAPNPGTDWPVQIVSVPVLVRGARVEEGEEISKPLAEQLPGIAPAQNARPLDLTGGHSGIACTQEPDPGLVRYGQNGVVHLGIRNIGTERLRLDKISAIPAWISYPGEFRPFWIKPGETQFLGLSVASAGLTGGDYKAEVTFTTSVMAETMVGSKPIYRDMTCEVRIRVVRGSTDALPGGMAKTGCVPLLLALGSSIGLICWTASRYL
jgi:tRNA A-37 threonylcarbamoyl transferase component Bud32